MRWPGGWTSSHDRPHLPPRPPPLGAVRSPGRCAVSALAIVCTRALRVEAAAGQWAATERALYLAAVDACVRLAPGASAPMLAAHRSLRAYLRADGAALYGEHALDGRTAVRWTEALRTVIGLEVDAIAARLDCDRGAVDRRDLRAASRKAPSTSLAPRMSMVPCVRPPAGRDGPRPLGRSRGARRWRRPRGRSPSAAPPSTGPPCARRARAPRRAPPHRPAGTPAATDGPRASGRWRRGRAARRRRPRRGTAPAPLQPTGPPLPRHAGRGCRRWRGRSQRTARGIARHPAAVGGVVDGGGHGWTSIHQAISSSARTVRRARTSSSER